jgi:hypothetical protein
MNYTRCPNVDSTFKFPRRCSLDVDHNGTHFDLYGREWVNLPASNPGKDNKKED